MFTTNVYQFRISVTAYYLTGQFLIPGVNYFFFSNKKKHHGKYAFIRINYDLN